MAFSGDLAGILGSAALAQTTAATEIVAWPVLHDHRTDHQRNHPAHPGRHPAARRQERRRGQGQKPDPRVRVSARRDGAGNQRAGNLVRPGEPDLQGAGRRQADRGLRTAAARRAMPCCPVVACTEIVMGTGATLGPITPENQSFDPAFREPVRFLALREDARPGPASGHARSRGRPAAGPHGRQGAPLRAGRQPGASSARPIRSSRNNPPGRAASAAS